MALSPPHSNYRTVVRAVSTGYPHRVWTDGAVLPPVYTGLSTGVETPTGRTRPLTRRFARGFEGMFDATRG